MARHSHLSASLTRVAKWAGALSIVGFGLVIVAGYVYRDDFRPVATLVVVTLLATITAGFVSLIAFGLRGAVEQRWRYSLGGLLVATTVIALALGFFVAMLR
jgi:hypothetical protein